MGKIESERYEESTALLGGRVDYPTVLRLIRETRTTTGLTVSSSLDTKPYSTGIKLTTEQIGQLSLYRHNVLPNWNYTLLPNKNRH